jgi:tripartite-type tricarboxylate transporter receptor subunit TctC
MLAVPNRNLRYAVQLLSSLLLFLILTANNAASQEINILVPFTAGGSADYVARLFATHLNNTTGVSTTVMNVDGGSGVVAFRRILNGTQRPEILVGPATPVLTGLLSPAESILIMEKKLIVCQIYENRMVLVQRAKAQTTLISELLTSASSRISSGGPRSIPFLALASSIDPMGNQFTHVPFRGEHPALVAVAQGVVEAAVVTFSTFVLARSSLDLKAIAIVSSNNLEEAGGIPVLGNSGFVVRFASSPAVVLVQPNAGLDLINRLRSSCESFTRQESTRKQLVSLGIDPVFKVGSEAISSIASITKAISEASINVR